MDKYTIDEIQYKNGYRKGYEDGRKDAVEVVHGRWIVDAVEVDHPFLEFESVWRDVHQCSMCKEYFDVSDARNYCPNCGAKMDGGNTND